MAYSLLFRECTIDFTETSGKSVRRTYRANPATVTSDALWLTAVQGLVAILAPLTNSGIIRYTIHQTYFDSGVAIPSSAENSNQALLSAKIASDPTQSAVTSIPAIVDSAMVASTGPGFDIVDVADSAVQAFTDEFKAGGNLTISDGQLVNEATWGGRRRNVHSLGT
jgi:hypothetical protein